MTTRYYKIIVQLGMIFLKDICVSFSIVVLLVRKLKSRWPGSVLALW